MALIPYLTVGELDEPHREYAERFNRSHGRLPWLRLLAGRYPPLLDALAAMYPRFMAEGSIDRVTKELLFVACAQVRDCKYCMGSHSRHLVQELGLTREQVVKARDGEDAVGLTHLQKTIIRFGRKVAENPQKVVEGDVEELRAAGLSEDQIVEIVAVCSFSAFTNTFTDALRIADDLEMMGMQEEFF